MEVIVLIFFFAMVFALIEDSIKTEIVMPKAKFEQKQEVKQFIDENIKVEQEVHLDTDDLEGWMVISHNCEQISMSIDNWKSLVDLANNVLNEAYPNSELKENWEDDLQS
ncbi:MAG: hypothetical protein RSE15_04990 [Flavobacterium sp.]|uniref:hypothetical protein n=1 Tax=Flavobacterium sp. TaxID=239 RepID=UPI002B49CFB6|nr:hypothetical protein [Flavobacterium sp.]WRH74185.1 MAG: hypothetical protein RSE15_04990 [Flavobacterium sp.]